MHVGGKALKLDSRIFDNKHGTVLDSGTTYAYLPEQAFVAFRDGVSYEMIYPPALSLLFLMEFTVL